jgi:phosphoribosyl 1,2-cyclic phosphate phosphodiesterase
VEFLGQQLHYVTYRQPNMAVNGFRIGPFAYLTDIKSWPAELMHDMKGVELLILGAIGWNPSEFHMTIAEAAEFAQRLGAKRTYLTHLSHGVDFADADRLPEGVFFAYDGLELTFQIEEHDPEHS